MLHREDIHRAAKTVLHEMSMVEKVLQGSQRRARLVEWEHVLRVLRYYYKNLNSLQAGLLPEEPEEVGKCEI